jgi:uncharacterized protein (DUF2461 family)
VLWAFEQGEITIVPRLLRHWTSVIPVLSEESTNVVTSYNMRRGDVELYFNPDPKEFQLGICRDVNFSRSKAEIQYIKDYGLSES